MKKQQRAQRSFRDAQARAKFNSPTRKRRSTLPVLKEEKDVITGPETNTSTINDDDDLIEKDIEVIDITDTNENIVRSESEEDEETQILENAENKQSLSEEIVALKGKEITKRRNSFLAMKVFENFDDYSNNNKLKKSSRWHQLK